MQDVFSNPADGIVLAWRSATDRLYSVYSKTNLLQSYWLTNLYRRPGYEGIMSYTNSGAATPVFFRIGVEIPGD